MCMKYLYVRCNTRAFENNPCVREQPASYLQDLSRHVGGHACFCKLSQELYRTFLGYCLLSVGVVVVVKDCKLNTRLHSYIAEMLPFRAVL